MNDTAKTFIILGGANGSGKSTLASVLLQEYPVDFLNADEITRDFSVNYPFEVAQRLASREYVRKKQLLFQQNKSFILETTLSGRLILKTMADAKKQGYNIILVYCFLPTSLDCIRRVKKRVANGGHDVSEEDITRRYFRSINNFWNDGRFLADGWLLFYNGYDYRPTKVAYGCKDAPVVQDNDLYCKFTKIVNAAKEKLDVVNG